MHDPNADHCTCLGCYWATVEGVTMPVLVSLQRDVMTPALKEAVLAAAPITANTALPLRVRDGYLSRVFETTCEDRIRLN